MSLFFPLRFCLLGGNYVVQFLDKFSTAPALMLIVMMEAIAASWVSDILSFSLAHTHTVEYI